MLIAQGRRMAFVCVCVCVCVKVRMLCEQYQPLDYSRDCTVCLSLSLILVLIVPGMWFEYIKCFSLIFYEVHAFGSVSIGFPLCTSCSGASRGLPGPLIPSHCDIPDDTDSSLLWLSLCMTDVIFFSLCDRIISLHSQCAKGHFTQKWKICHLFNRIVVPNQ